jgi:hypothetical protein
MEGRGSWRFYQAGYGCVLRLQGRRVCHVTRALAAGVSVSRSDAQSCMQKDQSTECLTCQGPEWAFFGEQLYTMDSLNKSHLEERCYLGAQSAGLLLSRDSEMRQDGTGSGLWTSKGGDKHW